MKNKSLQPLSEEFAEAELGDLRLTKRLTRIVDAANESAGSSIPIRSGSSAALEGTYRFVENPKVSPEKVLAAHVKNTVRRAAEHPQVLVIHDTTKFKFGGEKTREGLGWLTSSKAQGFHGHFSICATTKGEPLGTLGLHAWRRENKPKGRRSQNESQSDPDRESLRWIDAALQTGALLYNKTEAIHLMDREGDSYELFAFLLDSKQRFVIRLCHDRRREEGKTKSSIPKLFERLSNAPFVFKREVFLSARKKSKTPRKNRTFPARASRLADLEVRSSQEEIFIAHGAPAHLPRSLVLNFVEIRESNPPDGAEPVVWRLVTTEPIDTEEQVAAIVDAYRLRWLVEEFFKAVKTGCRFQEHQLESSHSLLIMLSIEAAVAWRMLLCRWMAHNEPDETGEKILTSTQLTVLTEVARKKRRKIPEKIDATFVLYEIAALGGHIKNNGPPGWLVLRRGFEKLFSLEQGWQLAQGAGYT